MFSFEPYDLPVRERHGYLLNSISPRPIALASTVNEDGSNNLAPFSFFNLFSSNPPVAIFSPARSGRTNTTKHTYDNLKRHPEVVINMVNYAMAEQCALAGVEFAKNDSEFEKAGFTPIASDKVQAMRVKESPVQMECKVLEIKELGTEGGAGNLIIVEILKVHISEDILDENKKIDPNKLDLVGRMGGNLWCRASGDALFEINTPPNVVGIGISALPEEVRESKILTGNDLARLGKYTELPDETEVNDYKLMELSDLFVENEDDSANLERLLHERAQSLIEKGEIREALLTVLSYND